MSLSHLLLTWLFGHLTVTGGLRVTGNNQLMLTNSHERGLLLLIRGDSILNLFICNVYLVKYNL